MNQRRVVITGLGQISPVGNDVETAWQNLLAGKSGIGRITKFDASDVSCQIAGEVKDFDISQYLPAKEARRMDSFIHYGIAGALQAIKDAHLDEFAELDKDRVGVNIGSGIGGLPLFRASSTLARNHASYSAASCSLANSWVKGSVFSTVFILLSFA